MTIEGLLVALVVGGSLIAIISITFVVGQRATGLASRITLVQVLTIAISIGLTTSIYVALVEQFPGQYVGLTIAWGVVVLVTAVVWIMWTSFSVRLGRDVRGQEPMRDQVIRVLWKVSLAGTIMLGLSAAIAIELAHVSAWVALAPLISLLVFGYYSQLLMYRRK